MGRFLNKMFTSSTQYRNSETLKKITPWQVWNHVDPGADMAHPKRGEGGGLPDLTPDGEVALHRPAHDHQGFPGGHQPVLH